MIFGDAGHLANLLALFSRRVPRPTRIPIILLLSIFHNQTRKET